MDGSFAKVYRNDGFPELIKLIKVSERRILDVGCGAGGNACLLMGDKRELHGVTISRKEAKLASKYYKSITVANIETTSLRYPRRYFDAIIFSHVLEHTVNPWAVLKRLKIFLRSGGRCYIALPNVAYYKNRLGMLCGRFSYKKAGLMDDTHLRFFTFDSAINLVQSSGYRIVSAVAVGSFPIWPLRRLLGNNIWIDRIAAKILPNLFGYHVIIVASKKGM